MPRIYATSRACNCNLNRGYLTLAEWIFGYTGNTSDWYCNVLQDLIAGMHIVFGTQWHERGFALLANCRVPNDFQMVRKWPKPSCHAQSPIPPWRRGSPALDTCMKPEPWRCALALAPSSSKGTIPRPSHVLSATATAAVAAAAANAAAAAAAASLCPLGSARGESLRPSRAWISAARMHGQKAPSGEARSKWMT